MSPEPPILVVDDDENMVSAMARVLRATGREILQATRGRDALRMVQERKPALILLDVVLPDLDGFEVLSQIRELPVPSDSTVIFLSSERIRPSDHVQGLESGAVDYLSRPVSNEELLARVRLHLRQADLTARLRKSEARFRQLIRQQADGVLVVDREGRIQYANPAAESLFGRDVETLQGSPFGLPATDLESQRMDLHQPDGATIPADMRMNTVEWEGEAAWLVSLRDISELLNAERGRVEAIESKQALLRIAGRVAHIGGWSLELPDYRLSWSDEIREIHEVPPGFTPSLEEAIEFYPEEYRETVRASVMACITDGTPFDFEMELNTARSRRIWVKAIGEAVRDAAGAIIRLQGAFQDITERKRAEASLEYSEQRFRQLAESMPMIVWSATPEGEVNYSNIRFAQYTGVSPKEPPATRWQQCLHPDDLPRCLQRWQESVESGTPYEIEYRIRRHDGGYRWFQVQAQPVCNADQQIIQWYGSAVDIHHVKSLEQESAKLARQFSDMLESMTDAFFALDPDWRFTYVNSEMLRIVGLTSGELIGHVIWDIFPEARDSPFEAEYRRAREEQVTASFEAYYPPLQKWFEVRAYPSTESLNVFFRDVTQRHRDEEQLRLLQSGIDRVNDVVLLTEADPLTEPGPRIVYVNPAFEALTGYKAGEAIGRSPRFLQGPETDTGTLSRIRSALEDGEPVREEVINYSKDGSPYWIEMEIAPLSNADGLVTHFVAVQRDISRRKQWEKLQWWETEILKKQAAGVALAETMQSINKAIEEVFPGARSATLRFNAVGQDFMEESGTGGDTLQAGFGAAMDPGGEPVITENIETDPHWSGLKEFALGQRLRACWSFPVRDASETVIATLAIYHSQPCRPSADEWDIVTRFTRLAGLAMERDARENALRDSEERFRTLLQHISTVAVQAMGPDLKVIYWNDASESLYGYRREEAMGRNLIELLVPPASREIALRIARSLLEDENYSPEPTDWQLQRKDGTQVPVLTSYTVLRREGKPAEVFSLDVDLTERKKLEQQFLRSQRLESIGTLAGGIAHDLNNLLSPIVMGVSLLRKLDSENKFAQLMDVMEQSAERGAGLVRQILSFARGVEGARITVSFEYLVKEIESIIRNTFPKNITFEKDLPKNLWMVQGDPVQLNQVLMNLVVNARDAMPAGGVLRIRAHNAELDAQYAATHHQANPGKYLCIEVCDSGSGMSADAIDRIFEPFFTTKEQGQGTGLGLSTSSSIVRSHGGFIDVESRPGRGSSFSVFLPAVETETLADSERRDPQASPRGQGERILVVDDEPAILEVAQRSLESFGYRVQTAESGVHAIKAYVDRPGEFSLVITDMMMPIMDGKALIKALRKIDPEVRIIAASGLRTHQATPAADAVAAFLPKPYSTDQMLDAIHRILHPPRNAQGQKDRG